MKTFSVRGKQLKLTAFAICIFLCSCQKYGSTPYGSHPAATSSVNIFLTDDQSLVFDHVFLDISKVEIKVEDNDQQRHESEHQGDVDDNDDKGDTTGGWMAVDIHPGVYDILKFRNGLDTLFASASFPSANGLKKLRITLGANNSVVFNGVSFPLIVKDNDNFVVVKIDESLVQVNSGGLTNFWMDIDAGRSISQHGNDFELKTSIKVFSREKAGSIEGLVLPAEAGAIVMAINGTDTASAKPEDEGEFKFIGLKPGTYSLLYHATANNYLDTTVNNIIINQTEDVHTPTITLHK
jgi:hypothetical protein